MWMKTQSWIKKQSGRSRRFAGQRKRALCSDKKMVNKELKECEVKMKKIKGLIFAIGFVLCGFVLGACGTSAEAKQDKPLKIWFENQNGKMETYQLVDEETGVNYIVVSGELFQKGIGTAITPRLKADGSLYTSK